MTRPVSTQAPACRLCGSRDSNLLASLDAPPPRETDYGIEPARYRRAIHRCNACGVYFNDHDFVNADFYRGTYNATTYGDRFRKRYDHVRSLPREQSDNKHRAQRIHDFLTDRFSARAQDMTVLDIGMGLCVFLAEMKDLGFHTHGLDPDNLSTTHARDVVGVDEAWQGDAESFEPPVRYHAITLNKVLEHIADPVRALSRWGDYLVPGGVVYVELPDGEAADAAGGVVARQEFFAEHMAIYGPQSMQYLIEQAGLELISQHRLHEPSDKYTIYAFAQRSGDRD